MHCVWFARAAVQIPGVGLTVVDSAVPVWYEKVVGVLVCVGQRQARVAGLDSQEELSGEQETPITRQALSHSTGALADFVQSSFCA